MGRRKKDGSGECVPVGLRVRYEVVTAIYHSPSHPVKLPSAAEFAKKLHISQRSVTRELKKLSDEGLITGERGVGTFTKPSAIKFLANAPGRKIIGIINRDGRNLFADNTSWSIMSYAGMAMTPHIGHPRHIELSGSGTDFVFKELSSLSLDGIIWLFPPEEMTEAIQKLHQSGIPVISVMDKIPGIPFIDIDNKQLGETVAQFLLDMNKHKTLWCSFSPSMEKQVNAAIAYLEKHNVKTSSSAIVNNWAECEHKLKQDLAAGDVPEAIFVHGEAAYPILGIFEKYGIDPYRNCCLIVEKNSVKHIADFKGICRELPFEAMGNQAAEWMQTLLEQPDALDGKEWLWEVDIRPIKSTSNNKR